MQQWCGKCGRRAVGALAALASLARTARARSHMRYLLHELRRLMLADELQKVIGRHREF
jgi:hypothetical protein